MLDQHEDSPRLLLRVAEAAHQVNLSRSGLYELIRSGRLRSVKIGRLRLIPCSALTDFVKDAVDGPA